MTRLRTKIDSFLKGAKTRLTSGSTQSFELFFGVIAIISAFYFFFHPESVDQTALGRALHGWAWAWYIQYLIGGIGIVWGLLAPSARVEALGLSLFAATALIEALVIGYVSWSILGSISVLAMSVYLALFLA